MNRSKPYLVRRYVVFLIGLFINSLGVAFITKAGLGTSPISSIPYVLSLAFPLSLGQFTVLFNVLIILMQVALLRKRFPLRDILQLPVTFLFGYFIDLSMIGLRWMQPTHYYQNVIFLLIGCLILGFGVYIEVIADIVMLPGEGFVRAVTKVFHTDFGITKVCFDASMAFIALLMSLALFGYVNGVREGTVIAALLVGLISKFWRKVMQPLTNLLFPLQDAPVEETKSDTDKEPLVITISREYGSGGHEIGERIAKKLGIACYDETLIRMAAEKSGLSENEVQRNEQKVTNSFLYDLYIEYQSNAQDMQPKYERLYHAEQELITELAQKESCVIIGRMANHTLADRKNAFHVFVRGDEADEIQRVIDREGMTPTAAKQKIKRVNGERSGHYHYYTKQVWGHASNYDLTVNSSCAPFEQIADSIIALACSKSADRQSHK